MFNIQQMVIVVLGGGIGALTRYVCSTIIGSKIGAYFPFGTLFVNIVGCFVMGFFMMLTTDRFTVSTNIRLLVTVGFLGGLTTFSSFGYETMQLLRSGNLENAVLNIGANLFIGLFAIWVGIVSAKLV